LAGYADNSLRHDLWRAGHAHAGVYLVLSLVMLRYSWPGNIRELQNLIERAVILSTGTVLRVPLGDLRTRTIPAQDGGKHQTLEQAERAHILATVKETKWVLSGPNGAATRLGVNRSTLQFRMKKLGIVRPWACECQV
jgi:formate hydrogenlyase transcriptional activator